MKKRRLNELFRAYASDRLSPTPGERNFVSIIYSSVQDVIGAVNSLQIGSYPRFTAITPLHDLDVLYVLGAWNAESHDPGEALTSLETRLSIEWVNPTKFKAAIERQTHSVTIKFSEGGNEVFGVDIVPAYIKGTNEFGDDTYVVPEIAVRPHRERQEIREAVAAGRRDMSWIASDPRGYITVASKLNDRNNDFRKAVKLAKGWRSSCKSADPDFPLKSFHLEQAITVWMRQNPGGEIFDAILNFFLRLPDLIRYSQIPDRADPAVNIDAYVDTLNERDRRKVIEARDGFLIKLENLEEGDDIGELLAVRRHKRASDVEAFLFDQKIPVLTEQDFSIVAEVEERTGGFRRFILDKLGLIQVDRKIHFSLGRDAPAADVYKWKVKNDDNSPQPRGEITDHQTRQDPEHTKYNGTHYVECFAIRSGVCIARSRQNVVLKQTW